jgi:hypothetical protein
MKAQYALAMEILYVIPKDSPAADMFRSDKKVSLTRLDSIITKPHTFIPKDSIRDTPSESLQSGQTILDKMFNRYKKDEWTVQDNGFEVICKKGSVTNYYYGFRVRRIS